jgi:hypothetical protein
MSHKERKEPRRIARLYRDILRHPEYKSKLPETTRWVFEVACVGGGSQCHKENNKWCRKIWRHLYRGEPLKDDD